jgi:hypothetical protein
MTEIETLIVEVRQLRADVARLHAAHTPVHVRHGWMNLILKDLSTNPYTQYKVHMWGAIYWLINFPLICCLFFFTPTLWLKLGISPRRSHLNRSRRCRRCEAAPTS